jgi:hypothetical protein
VAALNHSSALKYSGVRLAGTSQKVKIKNKRNYDLVPTVAVGWQLLMLFLDYATVDLPATIFCPPRSIRIGSGWSLLWGRGPAGISPVVLICRICAGLKIGLGRFISSGQNGLTAYWYSSDNSWDWQIFSSSGSVFWLKFGSPRKRVVRIETPGR